MELNDFLPQAVRVPSEDDVNLRARLLKENAFLPDVPFFFELDAPAAEAGLELDMLRRRFTMDVRTGREVSHAERAYLPSRFLRVPCRPCLEWQVTRSLFLWTNLEKVAL